MNLTASPFNQDRFVPPQQVKFLELKAEPQANPLKVRVFAKKPPSKEFPTIELAILDAQDNLVTEATLITVFQEDFVITMHIPEQAAENGPFVLHAKIIFEDSIGVNDHQKRSFQLTHTL